MCIAVKYYTICDKTNHLSYQLGDYYIILFEKSNLTPVLLRIFRCIRRRTNYIRDVYIVKISDVSEARQEWGGG